MGIYFAPKHSNLIAYVTTPKAEAPRALWHDLVDFVDLFAFAWGERQYINVFISESEEWLQGLAQAGASAQDLLANAPKEYRSAIAPAIVVQTVLRPIREAIGTYSLYALATPGEDRSQLAKLKLAESGETLARQGERDVLVLIPSELESIARDSILDALPPMTMNIARDQRVPGLVLWTQTGATAFIPLDQLQEALPRILEALRSGSARSLDPILQQVSVVSRRRILHLSDLHFGSKGIDSNLALLQADLHSTVKKVDHIVITGDLIDTPDPIFTNTFKAFHTNLEGLSRNDVLLIPGNHDLRRKGTFGDNFKEGLKFPYRDITVSDETETIFISLNSCISGDWAKGEITSDQRKQLAAAMLTTFVKRPEAKSYLKVALVHHHPIPFKAASKVWYQKVLKAFNVDDDDLLKLVDGQEFLNWCARWDVSAILHGHKHIARRNEITVSLSGKEKQITAIGCGTSLGAEGYPCSYDIVSWEPVTNTWSATFFRSDDGGPFEEEYLTVASTGPTGVDLELAS